MLPSINRFHGHNSVRHVYGRGRSTRAGGLGVKFLINPHRKSFRVAVAVSKQVNKSAVVRNRIRRRVYEVIRASVPPDTGPHDLVFTVFDDKIAKLPNKQLRQAINSCLKQALLADKVDKNPNTPGRHDAKNVKIEPKEEVI